MNLPAARSRKQAEARDLILMEAIVVGRRGRAQWTSYSRRREYYAQRSRYFGKPLTYATVVPTVDELAQAGWLEHEPSAPGQRGQQSRYQASAKLMAKAEAEPTPATYEPREIIVVRDHDRHNIDYAETEETRQMRAQLVEINEAIASVSIVYGGIEGNEGGVLVFPDRTLTIKHSLHRVFNEGDFAKGGRLYGATWQNIPKACRADIVIDGEPTIEHDHRSLHARLLYAVAGQRLDFDPYDVPGCDRELAKTAFLTLVNARNELSALRSIAGEIRGPGAFAKARALIQAVKDRNPAVSHLFGSCIGLRLQRIDSEMAETVQRDLLRCGVAALPVHDLHIVQFRHGDLLEETMHRTFDLAATSIAGKVRITVGYSQNVPQYGALFPACPVLFCPVSLPVPANDDASPIAVADGRISVLPVQDEEPPPAGPVAKPPAA